LWLTVIFFIIFSLVSDATASITTEFCGWMQKHWTCSKCKCDFLFNLQERMQHELDCEADGDSENAVFLFKIFCIFFAKFLIKF
jgi:hypothetical protein